MSARDKKGWGPDAVEQGEWLRALLGAEDEHRTTGIPGFLLRLVRLDAEFKHACAEAHYYKVRIAQGDDAAETRKAENDMKRADLLVQSVRATIRAERAREASCVEWRKVASEHPELAARFQKSGAPVE